MKTEFVLLYQGLHIKVIIIGMPLICLFCASYSFLILTVILQAIDIFILQMRNLKATKDCPK